MSAPTRRDVAGVGARELIPLLVGIAALAAGTAFGWDARLVDAVVSPPPVFRAALVGASAVLGAVLLAGALRRLGGGAGAGTAGAAGTAATPGVAGASGARPDLRTMVRGVRLVFLALAAFAAGTGWLLGHPLPIVVALVIAGVDVVETSFLLLVVGRRS